ncbi:MAG: hypothetical protein JNM63_04615 [Spirochaetia bacterium]|nr:hypothetical protein [Spirochaetia bacterium]
MREDKESDYDLDKILQSLFDPTEVRCKVPRVRIRITLGIFISSLLNLAANAKEAYQRRYGRLDGFRLEIEYRDGVLFVEDNAGGFDTSLIGLGVSKKSDKGHGIFLHTLLRDAGKYGMGVQLERLPSGTRVAIHFLNPVLE